jgi:hypothetical protein
MARVLITGGPVYGCLDDNKLVSNRVRGIWACQFAGYLSARGHSVTLLLADTMPAFQDLNTLIGDRPGRGPLCRNGAAVDGEPGAIQVVRHDGYESYREQCFALAKTHDAAVLAAAVVNWIPVEPVKGKMPTAGYKEGDIIQVPFVLAPRVIQGMKSQNPKLTLIGCKMLIGSTEETLIDSAYSGVLLPARCNAVVANDMGAGLKCKYIVNKDRSVQKFDNDFDGFFGALANIVEDEHFHTEFIEQQETPEGIHMMLRKPCQEFDRIVERNRNKFLPVEGGRVFGSVAVHACGLGWLVSPREKGELFTSKDATIVQWMSVRERAVRVPEGWSKPTLNAPLLIRFAMQFNYNAVLHYHQLVEMLPTLPYAQPGTVRDNCRELPEECRNGFNIKGHGCVIPVLP